MKFRFYLSPLVALTLTFILFAPLVLALNPGWEEVFSGYGETRLLRDGIYLAPMASTAPDETHAALYVNDNYYDATDYEFDTREFLIRQLRTGSDPNSWEVGWIMFRYTDLENYYYFILKSNGVELGKKQGSDEQIFLQTNSYPTIRRINDLKIIVTGDRIRAYVGPLKVIDYTDPDPITTGTVGLYTEDAEVAFLHPEITLIE